MLRTFSFFLSFLLVRFLFSGYQRKKKTTKVPAAKFARDATVGDRVLRHVGCRRGGKFDADLRALLPPFINVGVGA